MTNPYGPSGPSNHSNPGRGSAQSRPVGASMPGGGPVSGGERGRVERPQNEAPRPRSPRLIVGSIIGVLVVALLGIGSFVVFHEGGIGLGGSNSPTPTARATGNGEQYSTQYLDGAFTVNTTRIEQGPVDKEGADTLLVTYTLVNNTAKTRTRTRPCGRSRLRINNRTRQPMMKSGFGTRTEAASLGRIEETS